MTERELLNSESGVELWKISLPTPQGVAMSRFLVKREPEEWLFANIDEAEKRFDEEVKKVNA